MSTLKKFLELNERFKENENTLSLEEAKPGSIAEKKGTYVQNIKNIEEDILQINEKLTSKEDSVQSINQKLYDINTTVLGITERKVRAQTIIEGLKEKKKEIELKSLTDFKHPIAELPTFAEIDVDEQVKTSEIESQIQKLKDRRERMGAVNLRADNETQELQDQIDRMMNDRKDLVQGIQKLKSSINDLNEKGRERLLDAFEKVSRKFNDVYTKLFAGGNARLELIESDDPLEAGLELLVSPPGKKLQSITLLSGGEQALTAMALIFAVFLINPSPICILDEVDAPLDDANVTRFCSLLDELSSVTDTKFVIITHHALTMSRMNRLYGVTMAERGVSQLVAVDLEKAEEMAAINSQNDTHSFNAIKAYVEYINRLWGAITGLIVFLCFLASLSYFKANKYVFIYSLLGFFAVFINALLGAIVVNSNLIGGIVTVHFIAAFASIFFFILARNKLKFEIKHHYESKVKILALLLLFILTSSLCCW